jgi:bis(5'-adenosyl)-triphosphatase
MWTRFLLLTTLLLLSPAVSMTTTSSTDKDMRFGKFVIPSSHIFHRTKWSAAFVNLRPIVPGHVLVMPERIVTTMEGLTDDEYLDLWTSVRSVQRALKAHYQATAFNVAVQDGRAAGQSVPHVHVHILPRTAGDFERNDDVYEELEAWAPRADMPKPKTNIDVPEDDDRVDRTPERMADEAATYRRLLESSKL